MRLKINSKAGTRPEFEFTYPDGFVMVIDTREKAGLYRRPPKGLVVVRDTLPAGDYSVRGFETEIVIERKSVMDLYNSLFGDWARELKKLEKIRAYHRKWLVVDGSEDEVLRWQEYSQVHPNSMRGRICAIDVRLGIPVHYSANKSDAERFVLDRLIRYYKDKRENRNGFDK